MRAYRVAYDGRPFAGFQRQPDVPTVEDELLNALSVLGVTDAETPTGYAAAGRTDAGVSALAQTVAFETPDWLTPAAFNSELPASIRAWAAAAAPEGFHATHDAATRTYVYHLYAPETEVADARARAAFDGLCGEHDFHNLTPDDDGTVRTLGGSLVRDGDFLAVTLEAGGFARQLVRRVVSLVAAVGRGNRDVTAVDRALASDPLPGHKGIPPAPAHPLVLQAVTYPGLTFERDADAAASARTVFEERHVEHAGRARVTGTISDSLE